MSWSYVRGNGAGTASAGVTSISHTATSAVAAGDYVVVYCSAFLTAGAGASISVSDNVNGAYSQLGTTNNGANRISIFGKLIPPGGGGLLTWTATPSSSTFYPSIWYDEFSPGGSVITPGTAATNTGSSTAPASGAIASSSGNLVVAAFGASNTPGTVSGPGGSWVSTAALPYSAGHSDGLFAAYLLSSPGGAETATWAGTTSAPWFSAGLALSASGAASIPLDLLLAEFYGPMIGFP